MSPIGALSQAAGRAQPVSVRHLSQKNSRHVERWIEPVGVYELICVTVAGSPLRASTEVTMPV